ncbi:MAG TPA: guanylate kinase [Pyrinomonadaceae bacterium]|nr:guanylate kinase [Pyrinomonadaceae bacterium]
MKGNLIIITSPSGGGKGTLIREVRSAIPEIAYSVSLTTRAPRWGEEDGRDYHFVTPQEFKDCIESNGFLEYAEVHGNLYGTSKAQTERFTAVGRDVILEIDVQGAMSVMGTAPDAVSIFIMPPSFEVLQARLTSRNTEDAAGLQLRLKNSRLEVQHYDRFKYLVINDEVRAASRAIASIILAERHLRIRQTESIQAILDSFAPSKSSTSGE